METEDTHRFWNLPAINGTLFGIVGTSLLVFSRRYGLECLEGMKLFFLFPITAVSRGILEKEFEVYEVFCNTHEMTHLLQSLLIYKERQHFEGTLLAYELRKSSA